MCGGFLALFWFVCTNLNGNIKMYFDFKHTFCPSSLPSRQRPLCDRRLLWAGGTTTEAPVRRHDHVKNDTFHCARKSIRQKAAEPDFSETYLVGILSEKKPNQAPSQVPSALVQEAEKSNISRHAITWSKCITQFSCWSGIGVKSAGTQNNKYDPPKSRSFCSFFAPKNRKHG